MTTIVLDLGPIWNKMRFNGEALWVKLCGTLRVVAKQNTKSEVLTYSDRFRYILRAGFHYTAYA